MRLLLPALALAATAMLGGCNSDGVGGSLATEPVASAPPIPTASYNLPPGRPCSAEINRYQEVIGRDVQTGNLNKSVYDQIQTELSRAATACSAGQDGQAMALVRASQAKHGYHA